MRHISHVRSMLIVDKRLKRGIPSRSGEILNIFSHFNIYTRHKDHYVNLPFVIVCHSQTRTNTVCLFLG